MKAFEVTIEGVEHWEDSVIWSESRGRARWSIVRGMMDWTDVEANVALQAVKLKRSPKHDNWLSNLPGFRANKIYPFDEVYRVGE